jgi:hypothetical protein
MKYQHRQFFKESSMFDVVVVSKNVHMCGWGEGKGMFGAGQGTKQGRIWSQLIQSLGPARVEIRLLAQKATIPSKRV